MLTLVYALATLAPVIGATDQHAQKTGGHHAQKTGGHNAQEMGGTILHEPETGASLTLPEGWEFATGEGGLVAVSADKRGFVLLAAAEHDFAKIREDVKALILMRLDDVTVARSEVQGIGERGAIEGLVKAVGEGTSKLDGEKVQFAAFAAQAGDGGALALGAWKDETHAKAVAHILETLHIKDEVGRGGLELTDTATGTMITIPEGWDVVRSKKGLMTSSPDGGAMLLSLRWQEDFERELREIRAVLTGWVFKDIKLGEFAAVEASYDKSLGRIVAATGTAIDRADDKPVEFSALRVQKVDSDEGAALFGVWKTPEHKLQVEKLLATVKLAEMPAETVTEEK